MPIIEFQDGDWGNFIEIDKSQNDYHHKVTYKYSKYIVTQNLENNEVTYKKYDIYNKDRNNYYNVIFKNWYFFGTIRCIMLSICYFANYICESLNIK